MARPRIAIIGGGAAATLLLAHLALRPDAINAEYHLYDRTGRFAKGIAYSTLQMAHLLNVRASNMSAFAGDPQHFARRVSASYKPDEFVPRRIYGDYLTETLEAACRILSVTQHSEEVISCRKEKDHYVVESASGLSQYDRVVQATGNCQPFSPAVEAAVAHYYPQPWSVDYAALERFDDVTLIGCGLSAVDAILSLHAQGYKGQIRVVSRRTLLPRVHVPPALYPAVFDAQQLPQTPAAAFRVVRMHIERAIAQDIPWQAVIDAVRPLTNPIWQGWSGKEQARFMRHLLTLWNVHRHRMAPQIAEVLDAYRNSGRLHFYKARVERVLPGPRIVTTTGDIDTQAAINCLGYRYQERGRVFEVSDKIGPALFGPLFETTAIPEIRAQADALAVKLFS